MSKKNPLCPNLNLTTDYGQMLMGKITSLIGKVTGPEVYLANQTLNPSYLPSSDDEYAEALADAIKNVRANPKFAEKQAELNEINASKDATRPSIMSFSYTADDLKKEDILTAVYPDINDRIAMVKTMSNMFSGVLTTAMNQVKAFIDSSDNTDYDDIRQKLSSSNEEKRRLAFLKFYNDNYGQSFIDWFVNEINDAAAIMKDFCEAADISNQELTKEQLIDVANTAINFVRPDENIDFGVDTYMPDDNLVIAYIRNNFSKRIKLNQSSTNKKIAAAWKDNSNLALTCMQFIQNMNEQLNMIVGNDMSVMKALFKEAAMDISFRENLDINMEDNSIQRSQEANDNDDTTQTPNAAEDGEGGDSGQTGLGIINYHVLDPAKSLSVRIKKLLGKCHQLDSKGRPVADAFGLPSYLNPSQVFYELLHEFSGMYSPDTFKDYLNKVAKKFPWFSGVKDQLEADDTLFNEFYKTMRKQFVASYRITNDGLMPLNQDNGVQTLMHEVTKNYESKRQFGKQMNIKGSVWNLSIYDELGKPNINAIDKLNEVLRATKVNKATKKTIQGGGLAKAMEVLQNKKDWGTNYEALRNAIAYLHGETPQSTSVKDVIAAIGIDPANIDFNAILPILPEDATAKEIEEYMAAQRDMINDLKSILDVAHTLINVFKENEDHLTEGKCKTLYTTLASKLSLSSSPYDAVTYRSCGNTRSSYTPPTMIGDFVNAMKSQNDMSQYFNKEYMQYDFFKRKDGKCNNAWIRAIQQIPEVRKEVKLVQALELLGNDLFLNTVGKASASTFTTAIVRSFFSNQKIISKIGDKDIKVTTFFNPLYSDVDAMQGLIMPMFDVNDCLNAIRDIVAAEVDRITACRTNKSGYDLDFYNNRGQNFCFMPQLNDFKMDGKTLIEALNETMDDTERNAIMKSYVSELIKDNFDEFINTEQGVTTAKVIKKILEDQVAEGQEVTDEDVTHAMQEFYTNFFNGQLQWMQMFSGDLAYYKNFDDYVKRAKEMYACGERGYFIDKDGNHIMEKAAYMADVEHMSLEFKNIEEVLTKSVKDGKISKLESNLYTGMLYNYKSITEADGQSYRTIGSFKTIYKGLGLWNDECEEAFQVLTSKNAEDAAKIKPLMFLLQTLKPFMITHESLNVNGRNEKVYVQHKNSEYALSAAYSLINSVFNKSPKMVAIQEYMEENGIDVLHFRSCTKHGYPKNAKFDLTFNTQAFDRLHENTNHPASRHTSVESYYKWLSNELSKGNISQQLYNKLYDEVTFSKSEPNAATLRNMVNDAKVIMNIQRDNMKAMGLDAIHEYDLNDMMIVQPTADHLIGEEGEVEMALFGSQLRNVLYADFTEDMMHEFKFGNGQKVNMSMTDGRRLYDTLITNQLLDSFAKVNDKFTDIYKLEKFLQSQMSNGQQYSDDIKKALTVNPDTGTFNIPLNAPNIRNKVEALLLSAFKNAIQKQKIRGGSAILVSAYGLSDDLHINWNDPNDPSKGYESMDVYLPATFQEAYKDCLVEHSDGLKTIDMNKLLSMDTNGDILKGIAYRIPTEDKYSAMTFRVKGFLPASMGSNIIMPREVITMSGTDFK